MGLLTWMPCIEDIHNQGLYSSTPSGTFTINNNGKIGKCLKITSSIDTGLSMAQCNVNQTGVSMGGWFKFNKTEIQAVVNTKTFDSTHPSMYGNIVGYNSYGGIAIVIQTNNIYNDGSFNYIRCFSCIREGSTVYNTSSYIIPFDTWVHIFLVCDRQKLYLYINGTLYSSTNNFTPSSVRTDMNFYICRDAIYGGNGPGGYFPMYANDVRIYDHALSPREVKEISKGLVLHYTLAAPGADNNIRRSTLVNRGCSSFVYNSGEYTLICPYSDSSWGVGFYISDTSIKWKSGETWLISLEVYTPQAIRWQCDINNKPDVSDTSPYTGNDYDQAPRYTFTNGEAIQNLSVGWNKVWFTQKAPTTYGLFNYSTNFGIVTNGIGSGNSITVKLKNIKGEIIPDGKPLIPTPWIPNVNDPEYTKMGYNNNIEYDVSGFKNNGTKVGALTYSSDTPKYWTSTYFTSGTYINAGKGAKVTDAITVNLWVNIKTYGGPISCTEGGGWNFEQSGGYIRFPVYVSSVGYVVAQSPSITVSSLQNNWHMLTGTYDRSNVKLYVDGVLQATVPPSTTGRDIAYNTNNVVFISGEAAGNDTTPAESVYTGSISDVRIYATALSADDILELYHTPVTLTSNGVLMTSGEFTGA